MLNAKEARKRAMHGRTISIKDELAQILIQIKDASDAGEFQTKRTLISEFNILELEKLGFEVTRRDVEAERFFTVVSWE